MQNIEKNFLVFKCGCRGMTVLKRLKCLKLIKSKKYEFATQLAEKVGATEKTVRSWLTLYKQGGLNALCRMNSGGNAKKVVPEAVSQWIKEKLDDPRSTITSYAELCVLIEKEHGIEIKYRTLYGHCRNKYQSRLKVARKSHIKKDEQASEAFKKTG